MKNIRILSSAESTRNIAINDNFVSKLQKELGSEAEISWAHYDDIKLSLEPETVKVTHIDGSWDESNTDFVYFKSYQRHSEQAAAVAQGLGMNDVKFMCSELENSVSASKLSQYARLARAGFLIPKSLFIARKHLLSSFHTFTEELGASFILKAIDGKGGDANYLINDESAFKDAIKRHAKTQFIGQSFVPNKSDLRLLVIGGEVKLIIERQRLDDTTHLNNTSQGAQAREIPVEEAPESLKSLAQKAAKLFNREIAGVDIMFDAQTDRPYVLEVNASPQVASGAFTGKKIDAYCEFFKNML